MRIAIVGAGISGLGAARHLSENGHGVVVFERESHVGGRCLTVAGQGFVFDMGATSIAPRGKRLEATMLKELSTEALVEVEKPIYVHDSLRVSTGDSHKNAIERYTYRTGNQHLCELIAESLDVRLSSPVKEFEKHSDGRFRVLGEEFDALILTAAGPETLELLTSVGEFRPLQSAAYRSCLSVGLGFEAALRDLPYHALVEPNQRHPLTWLSVESQKSPGRAPEGCTALVAQLSPEFSRMHMGDTDDHIVRATLVSVARLYGEAFASPKIAHVVRWKYSQPEMTAMFESVNRNGANLLVAGDAVAGGRVEYAYEAGIRAAEQLLGVTA